MNFEPLPSFDNEIEDRQKEMLAVLNEAVDLEDYEFSLQIATAQRSIEPYLMVEYMGLSARHSKDLAECERWVEILSLYYTVVAGGTSTAAETKAMQKELKKVHEHHTKLKNKTPTASTEIETQRPGSSVNDWERDQFFVDVEDTRKSFFRTIPAYSKAEKLASLPTDDISKLEYALELIAQVPDIQMRKHMNQAFDEHIYNWAEKLFCGIGCDNIRPGKAKYIINKFMSSDESKQRARSALDKHVFQLAEQLIDNEPNMVEPDFGGSPNTNPAKRVILEYASTPGRREAMLFRLGLI